MTTRWLILTLVQHLMPLITEVWLRYLINSTMYVALRWISKRFIWDRRVVESFELIPIITPSTIGWYTQRKVPGSLALPDLCWYMIWCYPAVDFIVWVSRRSFGSQTFLSYVFNSWTTQYTRIRNMRCYSLH